MKPIKQQNNRSKIMAALTALPLLLSGTASASGGFANSKLATGTTALLNDVSSFFLVAGPIFCIVCAVVFTAIRGSADEAEAPRWTKRIRFAIICAVAVPLISGIVTLLTSYYI